MRIIYYSRGLFYQHFMSSRFELIFKADGVHYEVKCKKCGVTSRIVWNLMVYFEQIAMSRHICPFGPKGWWNWYHKSISLAFYKFSCCVNFICQNITNPNYKLWKTFLYKKFAWKMLLKLRPGWYQTGQRFFSLFALCGRER